MELESVGLLELTFVYVLEINGGDKTKDSYACSSLGTEKNNV